MTGPQPTSREVFEEGLATGRLYAEADIANQLGTSADEEMLRAEARIANEQRDSGPRSREFAILQLGVIRGYREVAR